MPTIDDAELELARSPIDEAEAELAARAVIKESARADALPVKESDLEETHWIQQLIEAGREPVPYKAIGTALDVLAMPGDYTRGVLKGRPGERVSPFDFFTPSSPYEELSPAQGAIRGAAGMMIDPLVFAGPVGGMVSRYLRATPTIPAIAQAAPRMMGEIDPVVASRVTPQASAVPDWPAPGPRVDQTGNTLTVPALEPGIKYDPIQGKYPINRPPSWPNMTPGEYGPLKPRELYEGDPNLIPEQEGQLSLLAQPEVGGKVVRKPEDQIITGEIPIRPQVARMPGFPQKSTAKIMQPITKALKSMTYEERKLMSQAEADLLRQQPAPSTEVGVKLTVSPRGSVHVEQVGEPVSAGTRINLPDMTEMGTAGGVVFPSLTQRAFQSTTDVLKYIGPRGKRISQLIDNAYGNRATLSSNNTVDLVRSLDEIAGRRSVSGRVLEGIKELSHGENAFVLGLHRVWNFSEPEVESLFNYMYTQRRMAPLNEKVRAAGEALSKYGLETAAAHPGVRELKVWNPLTGKNVPVGEPGMFMPQQPVHKALREALRDRDMKILYEKAGGLEGTGLSFEKFRSQIFSVFGESGEVRAFKARGLENARLLDLEALGGSPYQWAKKLGYETDPFRATFRYNTMATLRGEFKLIEPELQQHLQAIAESGNKYASNWAQMAVDRSLMTKTGYEHQQWLQDTVKGIRDFNNVTLLQLGGIASIPQLTYAIARGGLWRSVLGTVDLLSKTDRTIIDRSGALLPSLMNELLQPTGPLAIASTGALRAYGVNAVDKFSRYFAGHVGNRYVQFLEQRLKDHPSSNRVRGLITELGGDPEVILRAGVIPDNVKARMIQNFSNYTAGVADARGLPLGGLNEGPWATLVRQYRTFAMNNAAEIRRQIKGAPTLYDGILRAVRLGTGGFLTGAAVHTITDGIWNSLSAHPSKVNSGLSKTIGDEDLAWIAESIVLGLGTVEGMLVLQAMDDEARAVAQGIGGPTASLAIGTTKDITSTLKEGLGPKSARTAARHAPIVGPMVRALLQESIDEETRMEKKRRELRNSLKPNSGFGNLE